MAETNNDAIYSQDNYKYGFKDKDVSILDTGKGLTEEQVYNIIWEKVKSVNKKLTSYKAIKKP